MVQKEGTKDKFTSYKPSVKLQRRGTAYPRKFQPSTTSTDDIPPSLTGSTSSIDSSSSNDTVPDNDEMFVGVNDDKFAGVKSNRDQDKKVSQRKASRRPQKSQEKKIVKTKPRSKKVIKQTLV